MRPSPIQSNGRFALDARLQPAGLKSGGDEKQPDPNYRSMPALASAERFSLSASLKLKGAKAIDAGICQLDEMFQDSFEYTSSAPLTPPTGANFLETGANGARLTTGGAWTNGSSRAFKEGFAVVDVGSVLAKVMDMPITTWTYKNSIEGTHVGPMAEDFKAAFGFGSDSQHIATVDADGIALAGIQGLNQKLEAENTALKARLDALEQRIGK